MSTARRLHFTYADYLSAQAMSEIRLEYFDGDIYAMAGGTPEHAAIAAQVIAALSSALSGRCLVFSSDLRIHIAASGLTTYPDVSVVCADFPARPERGDEPDGRRRGHQPFD